jgi:hypothetical protein
VLYLEAFWRAYYDVENDLPFAYSTCFPYWLIQNQQGKVKASAVGSPGALTRPTAEEKAWSSAIDSLYGIINTNGMGLETPREQYDNWIAGGNKTAAEVQQWIAEKSSPMWEMISRIDSSFFSPHSITAAVTGASGQGAKESDALLYYRVVSVDSTDDGKIFHRRLEGPESSFTLPRTSSAATESNEKKRDRQTAIPKPNTLSKRPRVNTTAQPDLNDADDDADEGQGDSDTDEDAIVSTTRTTSVARPEAPTVQDSDGYYFYCTDVDQPGVNAYELPPSLLNDFVTVLSTGTIALDAAPSSPPGGPQVPANFRTDDEWNGWFTSALAAKTMQAYGTNTSLTGFSFTISINTNDFEFMTDTVNLAFGLQPGVNGISPPGIVDTDNMVIFGLNPTSPKITGLSIKDVFAFTKQDVPAVLGALDSISLTMDPGVSGGKRNAVWFMPELNFKTMVRLTLDVEDVTTINDFFGFLTGFKITSAHVIAVQSVSRVLNAQGSYATNEGSVTIVADALIVPLSTNDINFTMAAKIQPESLELTWKIDAGSKGGLTDIISWLASLLSISLDFDQWLDSNSMKSPTLRQLKLTVKNGANGNPIVEAFSCTFEVSFTFGKSSSDENIAVQFVFTWSEDLGNSLSGSLWPRTFFFAIPLWY